MKVLDPILWSTLHFSTPLRPNHRRHTFTTAATVCLGCGLSLNITCETYNLHWALGVTCTIEMFVRQAPDETGRFLAASEQLPPDLLVENPTGEFARSVQLRAEAEKAQSEWSAKQRIMRAQHSKHRPSYNFRPGELVFYWRTQEANKGRRQPGGKHGRFLGPARILATESRTDSSGEVRPGGAIWLVKGRSLLKASPEQLRRATQREELIESMADPCSQQVPWTFHQVADQIGGNRFEDISAEQPDVSEWHRAQLPEEEVQPSRFRIRQKRPAEQAIGPLEDEARQEASQPSDTRGSRERSRSRGTNPPVPDQVEAAWWSTVPEREWPAQQAGYWQDRDAAVTLNCQTVSAAKRRPGRIWGRTLSGA